MIFIPTESLIFGCFGLAIFFYYVFFGWGIKFHEINTPERLQFIRGQLNLNRWLARLFLVAAVAFGVSASFMPFAEY